MSQGAVRIHLGIVTTEYDALIDQGIRSGAVQRILKRDASVFTADSELLKLIAKRLGWVDIAAKMKKQIPSIERFGSSVITSGIRHVVLIGMGGSSLCPELFKFVYGKQRKLASFEVLDSTDPAAIIDLQKRINLKKTLFIIASKSGGTVETRSHEAYFLEQVTKAGVKIPGRQFVAITDKGSSLEQFAKAQKYRKIFINPSDIGGRYSALSYFGLVPGFFAGMDLRKLIENALSMQKLLRDRTDESNPALALASLITSAAKAGQDKLTFITTPAWSPLVPWIEQLVAESTGKQGRGVVPIEAEPAGKLDSYGKDRAFLFLRTKGEKNRSHAALCKSVLEKKVPIVEIELSEKADLGGQFILWETATALAGYFLGINPFDEPNVTESKENTKKILAGFKLIGSCADRGKRKGDGPLTVLALDEATPHDFGADHDAKAIVRQFLSEIRAPHYVSSLCYFVSNAATDRELAKLRSILRDHLGVATLRGYGPRFLHSIGQLYKGGAPNGHFIVFVRGQYGKLNIPGQPFDFGQLICAQALGDTKALARRKLPALMISLNGPVTSGLKAFREMVTSILQQEGK